ncbi:hypothetical protein MCAL160_0597 [Mycoplasmopsis californica HAZ160_1]|uniref:Uncharacterized protein n=1 Tax=Mycoplasmopsis californica HAZ160_1 TaxID=1397850 RepID=A0AAT9F8A7_9BACT|nr:hypothetical protein MCAL160_0597 [Mycoplasmopsis californica HAZ160_1]BBG40972.1 hypothetical protein MCAL106_0597 [Mycoplasmopsis californica]BBG41565.1 hypothetical protein MCAL106E_0597 [Mycoplasmopsis californica]BBG42159.1 hypothetical protein MCAL106L_0597 [Mycoplasmopsis californica]BBG42741.1 hypothetical protein MCAL160E_0597 [Mycoplasmopsis californica]
MCKILDYLLNFWAYEWACSPIIKVILLVEIIIPEAIFLDLIWFTLTIFLSLTSTINFEPLALKLIILSTPPNNEISSSLLASLIFKSFLPKIIFLRFLFCKCQCNQQNPKVKIVNNTKLNLSFLVMFVLYQYCLFVL